MARRSFAVVVAAVLLFGQVATVFAAGLSPAASPEALAAARVQGGLLARLEAGTVDRFVVEFAGKANLAGAAKLKAKAQKGQFVVSALNATANAAQQQAAGIARAIKGVRYTTYWLTNVAVVDVAPGGGKAAAALATRLARLDAVTAVRAEKIYPLVEPVNGATPITPNVVEDGLDPEWGVSKIGAPTAWADGITGSGIIVANIDTGVDHLHDALTNQYRGSLGGGLFDHDFAWFDPTGICGDAPCDNAQHGTHTMGTVLGGDGEGPYTPDTGVAPGATWIAAKGCEDFGCSEQALIASGQWMLAPTEIGAELVDGDPAKAPDIINNSWGSGPGDTFYLETVQAWRAAGIIPVFASGNPGPFCGEGGSPGDFAEVISVGATDIDDLIAEFSGRGPSNFKAHNPDVAAPGVDVISTIPGGGFASFNGTSMATPHVTGTLALMLQADAGLRGNFDGAAQFLKQTAFDIIDESCGPEGGDGDPNNVYGEGRIDAALAVETVKEGGTLSGTVLDLDSDLPIAGARVVASAGGRDFPTTTDADGNYSLFLAAGEYGVSASAFGYNGGFVNNVVITTDNVTDVDFDLEALPRFTISGTITAVENGDPIEGAKVTVVATPLPPAFTNAGGDYTIPNVPIGGYELRVTANGCAESVTIENVNGSVEGEVVDADAALVLKLDDFGHGCGPIPFDWVDAQGQTALYGDEIGGRLKLPFAFPFYGEDYSEVWLAENGYVNFLGIDAGNFIPSEIPSASLPNAAVYPLWQDLWVIEGTIDHQTIGAEPDRAFVIEYDVELFGTETPVHVEMKLWEDGTIDFLYGSNPSNANGSQATVGIENAAGTDALQITYLEGVLEDNSALRISTVPVGFVAGTVTDANDGLPIAGATVTAQPGGRDTVTDADGHYNLVLRPGLYAITISAPGYVSQTTEAVGVGVGETDTVNAALESPTAAVSPTALEASVDFGETITLPVTISNDGSSLLTWEVKERSIGSTPVPLPEPGIAGRRTPTYREHPLPNGVTRTPIQPAAVSDLPVIIDDPDDDSTGAIETTAVRGLSDGTAASVAIEYAAGSPLSQIGGNVYFDTDQDPSTGLPPEAFFGLPTQDIGFDYWAELFSLAGPEPEVPIFSVETGDLVAVVPAEVTATSIAFAVPLEAIGGDDGLIDLALDNGTLGPEDWAPDEGHGTIESFSDVPWILAAPESGTTPPDGSSPVDITLGSADLEPGTHTAQVVFLTNAPRSRMVAIDVTLDVGLPAEFGALSGVVTDAHTTAPIEGASVVLHAEWPPSTPRNFTATTGEDGAYRIVGPAGTWNIDVSALDYEGATIQGTIASGVTTPGADAALHLDVPHADLAGDDVSVTLVAGGSTQRSLLLGNPGGHEPLTFEIGEVDLSGVGVTSAGAFALPADADRTARTTRGLGLRPANVPAGVQDTVGVLAEWPTGLAIPWGVGYDGSVWLSDVVDPFEGCGGAGACINADFTTAGEPLATVPADWSAVFNGDMAFDPVRNRMWQVNIDFDGGNNGIVGWDLATGEALDTITGAAFATTSQRGVAYDAASDTFYVGGWNEGVIYHVAGLDHPAGAGTVLDECSPADPNISGLAWNPAFQLLWVATNSETDSIYLIDPVTCEAQSVLAHPDGGGFNGAGLEMDITGNLWTVGQNSGNAYLLESGVPNFIDAPWLSVSPTTGSVAPDGTQELELTIDASGLEVGVYRALVVVLTNDPDNRSFVREVTLTVTDYLRGINAGGSAHTDAFGFVWSADQRWRSNNPTSFGYVGGGDTRTTNQTIAGTVEQGLFRNLREDMDGYRFSGLGSGFYQVDLHFADLQSTRVGQKIFDILLEGTAVQSDLDVFAAAGGRRIAHSLSFIVEVTDGRLDIGFNPDEDDEAIVNAILVTRLP